MTRAAPAAAAPKSLPFSARFNSVEVGHRLVDRRRHGRSGSTVRFSAQHPSVKFGRASWIATGCGSASTQSDALRRLSRLHHLQRRMQNTSGLASIHSACGSREDHFATSSSSSKRACCGSAGLAAPFRAACCQWRRGSAANLVPCARRDVACSYGPWPASPREVTRRRSAALHGLVTLVSRHPRLADEPSASSTTTSCRRRR